MYVTTNQTKDMGKWRIYSIVTLFLQRVRPKSAIITKPVRFPYYCKYGVYNCQLYVVFVEF